MRYRPCLAFCLIIAACGDPDDNRIATAPPGALHAGEWQIDFDSYVVFAGPRTGDTPMVNSFSSSGRSCIRPGQAARPEPAVFFESGSGCRYDRFAMGGGRIDALLKCEGTRFARAYTVRVRGTYESENFDVVPRQNGLIQSLHFHTRGRRVGDCRAQAKG
jgi:hypothetical protein